MNYGLKYKDQIFAVKSLVILSLCATAEAQTSMKVSEGPPRFHGKICEIPGAEVTSQNRSGSSNAQRRQQPKTTNARIVYSATWSVTSPGIVSYCVRPGVTITEGAQWNAPITLFLEDVRTSKEHPQENPNNPGQFPAASTSNATNNVLVLPNSSIAAPQSHLQMQSVHISIPTPIAFGATSMAQQPTCVTNLEWYKRPRLILREAVTGAVCPVNFGAAAFAINNSSKKLR